MSGTTGGDGVGWQSALVALGFLLLVGAIAVAAILRYAVDDALKIWTPLIALLGVVTGAFVSYFFTRTALMQANRQVETARQRGLELETAVGRHRAALQRIALSCPADTWAALMEDPVVAAAARDQGHDHGTPAA